MSALTDARVGAAAVGSYDPAQVVQGIRQLCDALGWADDGLAFGAAIPAGAQVVVKPNWVFHRNHGPWGLEPLVTHTSVISTVVAEILRGPVGSVDVCDAPVQGCDWQALCLDSGAGQWADQLQKTDSRFLGLHDLRRTVRSGDSSAENLKPTSDYTLFDLGGDSLLEAITTPRSAFRVTQYNPDHLARTHHPGTHQYLIARRVLDADVVVNLPKLKTHKKAGITNALKNLVGINGNKEYLPHHRVGGSRAGGDCYPGESRIKRALEAAYDGLNRATSAASRRAWRAGIRVMHAILARTKDETGIEGSWSGNDTVWRMALDLNRILLYGRPDGTMARTQQRRMLHIVDAVTAGQGDGPLSPEPLPLGLLLGGTSAPAIDWIGAILLGYDPKLIPIVRHAFDGFVWPLTMANPAHIDEVGPAAGAMYHQQAVRHPAGWRAAAKPEPASVPAS